MALDHAQATAFLESLWEASALPTLIEFTKIPNRTPQYQEWDGVSTEEADALLHSAADVLLEWVQKQNVPGVTAEKITLPGENHLGVPFSPTIFADIAASDATMESQGTVMLYGHFDKQPPFTGWSTTGPYEPDVRNSPLDGRRKMYGRGCGDDGYSTFAALSSIMALKAQGLPHARCVLLVEGSEESGSRDLPAVMEHLKQRIGELNLIMCLDSTCGSYDRMWLTTTLRGAMHGELQVSMLHQGVHSGDASGIVPDTFRIARSLLSRIEDEQTGTVLLQDLYTDIPAKRRKETADQMAVLGDTIVSSWPFLPGAQPVHAPDLIELQLNRTWRPQLGTLRMRCPEHSRSLRRCVHTTLTGVVGTTTAVVGAAGLPALNDAGPVLRPSTTLKVSLR
jgi:acetylornithine deacetylase/succinyl-diaminopimelate desuccinylase-like protein